MADSNSEEVKGLRIFHKQNGRGNSARGDVYYVATMFKHAGAKHGASDEEDTGDIDVEYLSESIFGILPEFDPRTERAGVVDEDVNPTEALSRLGDPCLDVLGQGDIRHAADSVNAKRLRRLDGLFQLGSGASA